MGNVNEGEDNREIEINSHIPYYEREFPCSSETSIFYIYFRLSISP